MALKPFLIADDCGRFRRHTMRTTTSSQAGFTLVEIMIVIAIIGLISAIAIPNFVKTRTRAQTQVCIENLAQIESAKQVW